MPDREELIKDIEKQMSEPTNEYVVLWFNEAEYVLELLKEQAKTKVVFGRTKDGEFVTECGNCGTHLSKAYSNCPKCKKELDWNSIRLKGNNNAGKSVSGDA